MVKKLEKCCTKQSSFDPCLFIGDSVKAVMYVDNILMWSPDEESIFELGRKLRKNGVELEEQDNAAVFFV